MITFVILAMAAAVTLYFAYYVFNALSEPYRTTRVYAYTANDGVAADGLVVRDALLLPTQNGILEITRAEGEKVGKGQHCPVRQPGVRRPAGRGHPPGGGGAALLLCSGGLYPAAHPGDGG